MFAKTPGPVDNLNPTSKGGLLAGLISKREVGGKFNLFFDFVLAKSMVNRYFLRIFYNLNTALKYLQSLSPDSVFLEKALHYTAHFKTYQVVTEPSAILEYDKEGNVIKSWQGTELKAISEAALVDGWLYLGSPWNKFAARVKY